MASASRNLGRSQDAEKYIKLAIANIDRMTERERYRTRGFYYLLKSDLPKCVEEYGALIARYSSDVAAHNNLAFCAADMRTSPKPSRRCGKRSKSCPSALCTGATWRFTWLSRAISREPRKRRGRHCSWIPPPRRASSGWRMPRWGRASCAQAAETYQRLEKVGAFGSIAASGLADLPCMKAASRTRRAFLNKARPPIWQPRISGRAADKFIALAYTRTLQGQKSAALAAAERALANSKTPKITFLAARIFVEAGGIARARELASGLAAELQTEPQVYAKLIEGEIAMKGGDARQAIKVITEANNQLDTWIGRFDLGRAYLEAEALPRPTPSSTAASSGAARRCRCS